MVVSRTLARAGWTGWRICGAGAVVALGAVVTAAAWVQLADLTLSVRGAAYVPLILMLADWLAWVRRQRLRACRPGGTLLGPLLVLAAWVIYRIGIAYGDPMLLHLGAGGVVLGCALSVMRDLVQQFLPAVVALAFLLPAGVLAGLEQQGGGGVLQTIVAEVTWTLCHLLGLTGAGSGHWTADHVSYTVAEAGNAMQLMLALCAVSYAFAFTRPLRAPVRALILGVTPAVVVLCSVLGLVVTVWVLGRFMPETRDLWLLAQWGVFAVAMIALVGLLRLMAWASSPSRVYPLASVDG